MITTKEVQEAIAQCLGEKNPNANTCIKLASFYIILDHLQPDLAGASGASGDFMTAISNTDADKAWQIMDDLMNTLQVVKPDLYEKTMKRLRQE